MIQAMEPRFGGVSSPNLDSRFAAEWLSGTQSPTLPHLMDKGPKHKYMCIVLRDIQFNAFQLSLS